MNIKETKDLSQEEYLKIISSFSQIQDLLNKENKEGLIGWARVLINIKNIVDNTLESIEKE